MGEHRIQLGDNFRITSNSSAALTARARVLVEFDNGRLRQFSSKHTTNADRSKATNRFGNMEADGRVVRAGLFAISPTTLSRGQSYLSLSVHDRNLDQQDILCQDYMYGLNDLALDRLVGPGPGDGSGFKQNRVIANSIAPADLEHTFGISNTLRRIDGFIWYYNCSGDVASRTLRASLRNLGDGLPVGYNTGLTTSSMKFWPSAGVMTLTADQEGLIYVNAATGKSFAVVNVNGAQTIEDITTDPDPFPYWAQENDVGELFFDVTDEEAADRHTIYIIEETWLEL